MSLTWLDPGEDVFGVSTAKMQMFPQDDELVLRTLVLSRRDDLDNGSEIRGSIWWQNLGEPIARRLIRTFHSTSILLRYQINPLGYDDTQR